MRATGIGDDLQERQDGGSGLMRLCGRATQLPSVPKGTTLGLPPTLSSATGRPGRRIQGRLAS